MGETATPDRAGGTGPAGLRIGVTGGIGSGKSTVAALLERCGALRFDADAVSRELTAVNGAAMPLIRAAFGPDALGPDGALNRPWMRQRAFEDPAQRRALEAILHPMIARQRAAFEASAGGRTVVHDIPLLAESPKGPGQMDRVLVVDCLEATQITRVQQRSGLSASEIERIMANQASRATRRALADAVLFNDSLTLAQLETVVQRLWAHWHPTHRPPGL